MTAFIHPSAVVDDDVVLGEGVQVWHFVHLSEGARVGAGSVLGQNVFLGRGVRLGEGVKVQNNVSIYEGVEVADGAFLGPSCVFTNVSTPRAGVDRSGAFEQTRVGRGATVGANATILCGIELGDHSFVGAGSVVTSDVAAHALVVGNPARQIGWMCACGERLKAGADPVCDRCSRTYDVEADVCLERT